MSRGKRYALDLVILAVLFLLTYSAFSQAARLSVKYPAWAVRYEEGFGTREIRDARQEFSQNLSDSISISMSFWTKADSEVVYENKSASVTSIVFDGDAYTLGSVNLLEGSLPGEFALSSVAISSELSQTLFGGLETSGLTIEIDGIRREICGIYDSEELEVIFPNSDEDREFYNVDIRELGDNLNRDEISRNLQASGFGEERGIIDGRGLQSIIRFMGYIPLVLVIIICIARLILLLPRGWRLWAIFVILLIGAIYLPKALTKLPQWLVPNQWSDLSFWSELKENIKLQIRTIIALSQDL